MSSDKWPVVAGISAALAAAAAFGQVIVAAVQTGQQSGEDRDIKDLQERVKAIEQQLRQNDVAFGSDRPEALPEFREIKSRVEVSARLDGQPQKEEFGEIMAQLEGTLAQNSLIDRKALPKKTWLERFFERKGAEYAGIRYDG